MIVRTSPDKDYAAIRNSVLQDSRLSFQARGMLLELLSRPEDWLVNLEQLAKSVSGSRKPMGIREARACRDEWVTYGYAKVVIVRENGRVVRHDHIIYDQPQDNLPPVENQPVGELPVESPQVENCTPYKRQINKQNTDLTKKHTAHPDECASDNCTTAQVNSKKCANAQPWNELFAQFWQAYPIKKDKRRAEKLFQKLKPDKVLVDRMLVAIELQTQEKINLQRRGQFVPEWKHAATWLNGQCWEDEISLEASHENGTQPSQQRSRPTLQQRVIDANRAHLQRIGNAEPDHPF